VFDTTGTNLFWSIKNFFDVLKKLKSNNFQAFCLSTSTLFTSFPHNLIRDNLGSLIEKKKTFARENKTLIACNENRAFLQTVLMIIVLYGLVKT
jgi:hypothetical protein